MTQHTKIPWGVSKFKGEHGEPIISGDCENIAYMRWGAHPKTQAEVIANAEFIVNACNSHDDLVDALAGCMTSLALYMILADGKEKTAKSETLLRANNIIKKVRG